MPIDVKCSACEKKYRVRDDLSGKKFKCKECGEIVVVPSSTASAGPANSPPARSKTPAVKKPASRTPPQAAAGPPAKKKKKRPAKKRPKPETFDDYQDADSADLFGGPMDSYGDDYSNDDYDEDAFGEAPPRKSKSKSKSTKAKTKKKKSSGGGGFSIGFNINRLNIALVVIGVMLIMFGVREARLAAKSNSEPLQITLADLLQNRPESIYLTVNDAISSEDGYIAEESAAGKLTRIWAPCHPPDSQSANFILYSTEPKSDAAAQMFLSQTTFTGMIINDIRSLGTEERKLLSSIPGVNVQTALIFEVGRTPSGAMLVILYFVGGIALILGGAAWIFLTGSGD